MKSSRPMYRILILILFILSLIGNSGCSGGEKRGCSNEELENFVKELDSRFNSVIVSVYGSYDYEQFLLEVSESTLPQNFFTESIVFEYLTNASNTKAFNSLMTKAGPYYVIKDEYMSCLEHAAVSPEARDIINTYRKVPEASPWRQATLVKNTVPDSEFENDSFISFLCLTLFSQVGLNISEAEKQEVTGMEEVYSEGGGITKFKKPGEKVWIPEDSIVDQVDVQPEFVGGTSAFYDYLNRNLRYPHEARRSRVEGTLYVQFVVAKDGSIRNIEVFKGLGYGCDAEAIRVMEASPNWSIGYHQGKPVNVRMMLPVVFKLNSTNPS